MTFGAHELGRGWGQVMRRELLVAHDMRPPLAAYALGHDVRICVVARAHPALRQRVAVRALCVVVLPLDRLCCGGVGEAAAHALGAPFALPVALGHLVERRIETIDVVADVAVVAQQQATFVRRLAAALAHRAVQTSPATLHDYVAHLFSIADRVHLIVDYPNQKSFYYKSKAQK